MNPSRLFNQGVILCFACLAFVAGLPGQEPAVFVTVFTTTMLQDCPLQILDLKLPEKNGDPPRVHLRNVSDKQTVRFWMEAQIMTDQGGLFRTNSNSPNVSRPSERVIAPAGEVDALEDVFESSHLASVAKTLQSNCLRVAVIVLSVDFADGTSWRRDFNKPRFRIDLPANQLGTCAPSAGAEDVLKNMQGAGIDGGKSPARKDSGPVQSYSFSCPLRQTGGGLYAMCRM